MPVCETVIPLNPDPCRVIVLVNYGSGYWPVVGANSRAFDHGASLGVSAGGLAARRDLIPLPASVATWVASRVHCLA